MSSLLDAQLHHKRWMALNHFEHLARSTQSAQTSKGLDIDLTVSFQTHGFLVIDATVDGICVGTLHLDPDGDGHGFWSVHLVETHPGWVRQGVATSMYEYALTLVGAIAHSNCRSIHGDAWAKVVGGEVPEVFISPMVDYEDFPLWLGAYTDDENTDVIDTYFPEG